MNQFEPIRPPFISTGESYEFAAPTCCKIVTVEDLGIHALSEQKTLAEHFNPNTPLDERRLSQILPHLHGSHLIGRSEVIIKVPEDYLSKSKCNEDIGIEIFAPTSNNHGNKILMEMIDDNFNQIMGMRRAEANRSGKDAITTVTELNDHQKKEIQTFSTHAMDQDHLDLEKDMPIVIFSHGMRVDPTVYRPLVEELASHGYIVLNLNHPASSARAPLGSLKALDLDAWDRLMASELEEKDEKNLERIGNEIWTQIDNMEATETDNIRFVVEQIRNGNLKGLPKDYGRENPIVLAGHSFGGTVSMIAARDIPKIAGCIDLDGRLAGKNTEERTAKLEVPTLLIFTERDDPEIGEFLKNNSHSTEEVIKGVEHLDFTLYPIVDWVAGGNRSREGLKAHEESSQAMLNFLKNLNKK